MSSSHTWILTTMLDSADLDTSSNYHYCVMMGWWTQRLTMCLVYWNSRLLYPVLWIPSYLFYVLIGGTPQCPPQRIWEPTLVCSGREQRHWIWLPQTSLHQHRSLLHSSLSCLGSFILHSEFSLPVLSGGPSKSQALEFTCWYECIGFRKCISLSTTSGY